MPNASTSFKLCIQLTFNVIVDLNDIGSFFADESRHDAWSSMLNSTQSYSPKDSMILGKENWIHNLKATLN